MTSFSTLRTYAISDAPWVPIGRWVAKDSDWLCGKWRPLCCRGGGSPRCSAFKNIQMRKKEKPELSDGSAEQTQSGAAAAFLRGRSGADLGVPGVRGSRGPAERKGPGQQRRSLTV